MHSGEECLWSADWVPGEEVWESGVSHRALLQSLCHLQPNRVRLLPTFERGNAWDVYKHLWRGLWKKFFSLKHLMVALCTNFSTKHAAIRTIRTRSLGLTDIGMLTGKSAPFVSTHFEHSSGLEWQDSLLLTVSAAWRHTDAWRQTVFSGKNFVGFPHWLLFSYAQIRMHPLHLTVIAKEIWVLSKFVQLK